MAKLHLVLQSAFELFQTDHAALNAVDVMGWSSWGRSVGGADLVLFKKIG